MRVKNKISLDKFKEKIIKYQRDIICPKLDINYNNIETNSCFDIKKYTNNISYNNIDIKFSPKNNEKTYNYCKQIKLYPTKKQKIIIHKWLNVYLEMYNITINYIKSNVKMHDFKILKDSYYKKIKLEKSIKDLNKKIEKNKKDKQKIIDKLNKKFTSKRKTQKIKTEINNFVLMIQKINNENKENKKHIATIKNILNPILNTYNKQNIYIENYINWYNVRKNIKKERDDLIKRSFKNDDKQIKVHILDCAIKLACSSYNQCKTNYMKNNNEKFRIRYWRKNKKTLQMEIGSEFIKQLKTDKSYNICYDVFGKLKCYYNNKPYNIEKKTVNIHYNQISKEYTLLVAEKGNVINNNKNNYISIDEGIRTFCTAITNNEALKIGTNIYDKIKKNLERIDNINNAKNLINNNKKIKERKYYRKIKNIVSELHWKTVNYITDNYKNIVIGDLSMKNASQKDDINKMTKRIGLLMSHYDFRKKLQYKCVTKNNNLEIINEYCTSKICSICNNFKADLKGEKIYECLKCKNKIDRDINGCRNILIKSLE